MPNRVMREGALHSRAVNAVSRDAELLWWRLLAVADDWGLFEADPYSIKVRAFGGRPDVTPEQCDAWLEECAKVELVLLYEDAGRELGAINKWAQRRFATRPKYPLPPWGETHILGGYVDPRARPGYEAPPPKPKRAKPHKANGADGFTEFYAAYPRHTGRAAAERAWRKLNPDPELRAQIETAVTRQRAAWTDPQFVPHPATWLNGRRWEDESPQSTAAAVPAGNPVVCAGCGKPVFGADPCACNPQTRRLQVAA